MLNVINAFHFTFPQNKRLCLNFELAVRIPPPLTEQFVSDVAVTTTELKAADCARPVCESICSCKLILKL